MMDQHSALEVQNLGKTFGAIRALHEVSFSLNAGEVIGLVGDNGAGKSTLLSLVSGSQTPSNGQIVVGGVPQQFVTPKDARAAGIETVYQKLALIPTLDIAENVYLTRETFADNKLLSWLRIMSKGKMRREFSQRLAELGLTLPSPQTKVAALSGGQRQLVAIARAVLWRSKIVLLDEPTAALGVKQTEFVLSFINRLKQQGLAVIFVSHNMEHVMRVTDRVVVLRLGQKVLDVSTSAVDSNRLVAAITGLDTAVR